MILWWAQSSFTFTAMSASTTIAFLNVDPANDSSNFIDEVVLVPAP
jgi:hypothetical protein